LIIFDEGDPRAPGFKETFFRTGTEAQSDGDHDLPLIRPFIRRAGLRYEMVHSGDGFWEFTTPDGEKILVKRRRP